MDIVMDAVARSSGQVENEFQGRSASNPIAIGKCLAMLEAEARGLGLDMVALLIGAARLAVDETDGRILCTISRMAPANSRPA